MTRETIDDPNLTTKQALERCRVAGGCCMHYVGEFESRCCWCGTGLIIQDDDRDHGKHRFQFEKPELGYCERWVLWHGHKVVCNLSATEICPVCDGRFCKEHMDHKIHIDCPHNNVVKDTAYEDGRVDGVCLDCGQSGFPLALSEAEIEFMKQQAEHKCSLMRMVENPSLTYKEALAQSLAEITQGDLFVKPEK